MSTDLKIILLLWKWSRGTLLCPQDFGVSFFFIFFMFLVFNCFLFLIIIIFNLIIFIFNYIFLLFCKIVSGYTIVSLCQDTQLCLGLFLLFKHFSFFSFFKAFSFYFLFSSIEIFQMLPQKITSRYKIVWFVWGYTIVSSCFLRS